MNIQTSVGLIALFAALTVFFALYALYAPVVHRIKRNGSIENDVFGEQVETYDTNDSLGKYVRPVLNNFLPQMPQINLGEERKRSLTNLIIKSGNPWKLNVEEFIGLQIALAVAGLLIGALLGFTGLLPAIIPPFVIVLFIGFLGYYAPYGVYNTRKQARTKAIQKELPEALDLLTITIASGQVFEFALESVTKQLSEGVLRTELAKIIIELQAGSTLEHSFTNFAQKFESEDLDSFTKAVIQSSHLGSDVSETLSQQADFVRSNYEARIERMIAKLETTMFIPLVITMLPALMLIFMAPTLSQLSTYLS